MSLPKPMMRGLLAKRLRFHLPIAFGLAIGAALTFKVRIQHTHKDFTVCSNYLSISPAPYEDSFHTQGNSIGTKVTVPPNAFKFKSTLLSSNNKRHNLLKKMAF